MSTDLYAQAALFYDMEYGDEQADVRLYAHLAERTRGPILDAGVGTGRIALGLAEFGRRVVGIDSSPAMLARAEAKRHDLDASSVTLRQADLRDFDLGEQFAMAVLALNTFAHMLTQDDQTRALACLHRHLAPGGLLALALENPYPSLTTLPQGELMLGWVKNGPGTDERTTMSYARHLNLVKQVQYLFMRYDVLKGNGMLRRYEDEIKLRWFYPSELRLLLEKHGFSIEDHYGGYELEDYTEMSPLFVTVASKA